MSALLVQLLIILCTARCLGFVLRFLGQPSAVGEMAAGIVLGPIVFGRLAPDFQAQIFEQEALGALSSLADLGVILFMFVVGLELRIPRRAHETFTGAARIGFLSMAVPMLFGIGLASLIYPDRAPLNVEFWPFALFLATAMSITALPVMARILRDHGMMRTPVGRISLMSAAAGDVMTWLMLALILVLTANRQDLWGFFFKLAALVVLVAISVGIVRPLLATLAVRYLDKNKAQYLFTAAVLIGLCFYVHITTMLGVHALFGAFLFGICLPEKTGLFNLIVNRIEYLATLVLMPVFFALAGLSTTTAIFGGSELLILATVLVLSIVGKMAGAGLAAYAVFRERRAALTVGVLMKLAASWS